MKGIFLSQREHVLYLLLDIGTMGCKPCDNPIDTTSKLREDEGTRLIDVERYQ